MPHSFGYRGGTRRLFKKAFGTKGRPNTTTFLRTYKVKYISDLSSFLLKLIHPTKLSFSTLLERRLC